MVTSASRSRIGSLTDVNGTERIWCRNATNSFGAAHSATREDAMNVIDCIRGRRAVRAFTPRTVEKNLTLSLIDAAIWAPSAMNRQPWAFAIVQGRDSLTRLSSQAKTYLLKTMQPDSPLNQIKTHLQDPSFDIFYGAPQLIIVSTTSSNPGSGEDCALAAQNLMLCAHSSGLGTCWIGLARPWLNQSEAKVELKLPAHHEPVAPIILGYPEGVPELHPRRAAEVLWVNG
jgi:nitroreductase